MSSVEIKITGVKNVKQKKPAKAKRKRVVKKKGISELKKKPEYFTTQFTQRPTYIERPPPVLAQPQIDYRPMFDKLMLQQLLLQNKGNDFREQQALSTTTLAKNQPSFSVSEVAPDEEKVELQKQVDNQQQLAQEALENVAVTQGRVLDLEEASKSQIAGMKKQIKDLEKEQQQKLSSLGIPAQALKDIQKNAKKKNLVIKGGL
jgi:hypothetical protein